MPLRLASVAGQPDLFVVCKSCGSEVSPYITECPYCGNRLRKRAPKLEKGGVPKPPKARRRPSAPALSRLRPGEMPGIRGDGKPVATIALVLVPIVFTIMVRSGWSVAIDLITHDDWRGYLGLTFTYLETAYEVGVLLALFLFGWLVERRHGPWAPLLVFALGSAAGFGAERLVNPSGGLIGANAGALALLAAWSVRDLLALRRGEEIESDIIGVAVISVLLLLLPAALYEPQPLAGIAGALVGLAIGVPLARTRER